MGEGYDLWGRKERQKQHQAAHPPGRGIAAQLQQATTRNADATIEKEFDWQARVRCYSLALPLSHYNVVLA
jgi:hypothetical protein